MNGRQSFEPDEFLDRLKRDEIYAPIVLYGMVKPAEDNDDYLLFAHGSVCENWFRIPLSSIENISVLTVVPCDDHKHPLVSLVLRQPETDEGRLFASLVQATSGQARNLLSMPQGRRYRERLSGPHTSGVWLRTLVLHTARRPGTLSHRAPGALRG